MRFLADENCDFTVVRALRAAGHDVLCVSEITPRAGDSEVIKLADDEKRSKYMPINKQYNLEKIKQGIENYFNTTKRKIFIEYLLLRDINDTKEDIDELLEYLKSIKKPCCRYCKGTNTQ